MTDTSAPSPRAWLGIALVAGSAVAWSYGGAIQRFIGVTDGWTIVFWRCLFAGLFLLSFMLIRDRVDGTIRLFRAMGWPGLCIAVGFALVSTFFVLAVTMTPVANVVLFMASIPLFAALLARIVLGEPITAVTWGAIFAVFLGVGIMVSSSIGDGGSILGLALAAAIPAIFACMTVLTRRYPGIRMTPAACSGSFIASAIAASQAGAFAVGGQDLALLFCFGALNLGLGMALYVTGARMIPSALAALIGTGEMILAPVWMVLLHNEIPSGRTILGGALVMAALFTYLISHARAAPRRPDAAAA
ncbi:DMT family transporter [Rhizobium rhizophilum]|uniref:DMT family transporter n=1 Tax=Rhizobium rhizophilum TaxID=1850373 RepID=A0ABY2R030_9HYPH|nr:DMT family transporter [Rhizobium rhizophilum]THV17202.1 DMT family transporter [Rhizobium rhizophilum]